MAFVPSSRAERDEMLHDIGIETFEDLLEAIPANLRLSQPLDLPGPLSEWEVLKHLTKLAGKNVDRTDFDVYLGCGIYDHYVPAVVDMIISRPEFATAYTPYQAEVSQGTLQSIYEFQTMIARLTSMDVVNASLYDGASATAEAVLLSISHTRRKKVLVSAGLHPLYLEVVRTYLSGMDIEIGTVPDKNGVLDKLAADRVMDDSAACLVVQSPNFYGLIEDMEGLKARLGGALLVAVVNPLSLGILKPPGDYGADICVGEAQVLGNPISYGGPGVGMFAATRELIRKIPGRLVARTADADGNTGYVLTLQTREQHIRRDKATSNICTNQALCALAATVYLSLLGKKGIVDVGNLCVQNAHYLHKRLCNLSGFAGVYDGSFFNEFVLSTPIPALEYMEQMEHEGILAGVPMEWFYPDRTDEIIVAVTEKRTKAELDRFVEASARVASGRKVPVS